VELELLRANLIRTLVPLLVGAVFSLLPFLRGRNEIVVLAGFAVSAIYYAVFRVAETRYPWLGIFLGKRMTRGVLTDPVAEQDPGNRGLSPAPPLEPGEAVRVRKGDDGRSVEVNVGGHWLSRVESVVWTSRVGERPLLTIRVCDVVPDLRVMGTATEERP